MHENVLLYAIGLLADNVHCLCLMMFSSKSHLSCVLTGIYSAPLFVLSQ